MNGEIQKLKMMDVIPSPDNPRHVKKDDANVKELAESIKSSGLIYPVICRPHPKRKGKFDLRAGFRRFLAHQVLDKDTISAIVRSMTDKVALEITILDNLQREDLTPLEEARGIKDLMAVGKDTRTIADEIGKTPQWVIRRAKLMNLSPKWLRVISSAHHEYSNLAPVRLELIARFDHNIQDSLFGEYWLGRQSMANFTRYLSNFTRRLKSASWKLDDLILAPKAGACNTCKKRSSVQPGLFDDELDPEKIRANDKCLDKLCWEQKSNAGLVFKEAELRKEYPNLLHAATGCMSYNEEKDRPDVVDCYKYTKIKKTTPKALPAIVVYGKNIGSLIWIKLNKPTGQSGGRKKDKDGKVKPMSMSDKKEQLRKRRLALVLGGLKQFVEKRKKAPKLTVKHYLALSASFGVVIDWRSGKQRWKLSSELLTTGQSVMLDKIWEGLKEGIIGSLAVYSVGSIDKDNEDAARNVSVILDLDYGTLLKDAEKQIPVPKSWSKDKKSK